MRLSNYLCISEPLVFLFCTYSSLPISYLVDSLFCDSSLYYSPDEKLKTTRYRMQISQANWLYLSQLARTGSFYREFSAPKTQGHSIYKERNHNDIIVGCGPKEPCDIYFGYTWRQWSGSWKAQNVVPRLLGIFLKGAAPPKQVIPIRPD